MDPNTALENWGREAMIGLPRGWDSLNDADQYVGRDDGQSNQARSAMMTSSPLL